MSYVEAPGSPGVRIVNPDDGREFSGPVARYAGARYNIPPGTEVFAPYEAAVLWLGDPTLIDEGVRKPRRDEYNRLCVKYGVYENSHLMDTQGPTLKVYSLDGQAIPMLIDDPDGDSVTPDVQTKRENEDLRAAIERQANQLRLLEKRLQRNGADGEVVGDATADAPPEARGPAEPRVGVLGPDAVDTPIEDDGEVAEDTPDRVAVS